MRNKEIKYELSTDYERLEQLLRDGVQVIGFVEILDKDGKPLGHSRLCVFRYRKEIKTFQMWGLFHEYLIESENTTFADVCKKDNIRYIPPQA